jgi:hypothetical protein
MAPGQPMFPTLGGCNIVRVPPYNPVGVGWTVDGEGDGVETVLLGGAVVLGEEAVGVGVEIEVVGAIDVVGAG